MILAVAGLRTVRGELSLVLAVIGSDVRTTHSGQRFSVQGLVSRASSTQKIPETLARYITDSTNCLVDSVVLFAALNGLGARECGLQSARTRV
jgi:hypothetical protein